MVLKQSMNVEDPPLWLTFPALFMSVLFGVVFLLSFSSVTTGIVEFYLKLFKKRQRRLILIGVVGNTIIFLLFFLTIYPQLSGMI